MASWEERRLTRNDDAVGMSLGLTAYAYLHYSITDAQVPELASFPPVARRLLRWSAFQQMFAAQPGLRWLPIGLCVFGALIGLFTFSALPRSLYSWGDDITPMFVRIGYILSLASAGGVIGAQWLTHRSRVYLRRLISSDGHGDTKAK